MVEAVVQAFLYAKQEHRGISLALYRIAPDLDGEAVSAKLSKRSVRAIVAMLQTAAEISSSDVEFAAFMFASAMAGTTWAVFEAGAPAGMIRLLRRHLVLMGQSYFAPAMQRRSDN